jgi:hypothetical protein
MKTKQAKAALIRLIEDGIAQIANLPPEEISVLVRDVEARGSPPKEITIYMSVFFLPAGSPFCCGEPDCHSSFFLEKGRKELGEYLRKKMHLRHEVVVDYRVGVEYAKGVEFEAYPRSG